MPLKEYAALYPSRIDSRGHPLPEFVESSKSELEPYGGGRVQHFGIISLPCRYNGRTFRCKFFLVNVTGPCPLGLPTGEALGIITINVVSAVSKKTPVTTASPQKSCYILPTAPIAGRPPITSK